MERDESHRVIGYCTNVHAGSSFEQTKANLATHALAVREQISPGGVLGIGLWLSGRAARELLAEGGAFAFARWLEERGLAVFTINGFPYGDFHEPRVKHRVYEPDWRDPRRLAYTIDLIDLLAAIVPPGSTAGISTLPLGWGPWLTSDDDVTRCTGNLMAAVSHLAQVEQRTGTLIHLDLEPEPGCALQLGSDVAALFERHLLPEGDPQLVCRHLRVCHDICHAAVMFEDQAEVFDRYAAIGVSVGKVQVSSAVRTRFDAMDDADGRAALRQLAAFCEPRYLHQTVVRQRPGADPLFFEDLPVALAWVGSGTEPGGEWRTHFHVPIFLERFGHLEGTGNEIEVCLDLLRHRPEVALEVETYAWEVLPGDLSGPDLASDIASELRWLANRVGEHAA